MATQVLLPLIASLMFLVGIWLAFVEIRNWWKAQTELYIKPPSRISRSLISICNVKQGV